jgi:hypothetical protein
MIFLALQHIQQLSCHEMEFSEQYDNFQHFLTLTIF